LTRFGYDHIYPNSFSSLNPPIQFSFSKDGQDLRALARRFYERDSEVVAKDLLGKILVRRLHGKDLEGILVETEAYYGLKDPASRAYEGIKVYNRSLWGDPGKAFIYNVHKYWMLNAVAHEQGSVGAVLIRAVQPTKSIEVMKRNRNVDDILELTSGPGKLTQAFLIDKKLNEKCLTLGGTELFIARNEMNYQIESSYRIGVKKDLRKKLRFFIKGNEFVSGPKTQL
jgi:DNA-3-methyladenine glycosylase